jgi:hypothetical protein
MEEQNNDLGQYAAIKIDERCVASDLGCDAGLGVGGDLQDVEVRLGLPLSPHLDQPVRQASRLDQLCR